MANKKQHTIEIEAATWDEADIRALSHFERGVYVALRLLMVKSKTPGVMLIRGAPPTVKEMAGLLSMSARETERIIHKLVGAGILVRDTSTGALADPVTLRAAHLSAVRSAAGRDGGGNPSLRPDPLALGFGQLSLVNQNAPPLTSALKKERRGGGPTLDDLGLAAEREDPAAGMHAQIEAVLGCYPGRQFDRPSRVAAAVAIRKAGYVPVLVGAQQYADSVLRKNTGPDYIPRAVKWLEEERWLNESPPIETYVPVPVLRSANFQRSIAQIKEPARRASMLDAEALRDWVLCSQAKSGDGLELLEKMRGRFQAWGLLPLAIFERIEADLTRWINTGTEPAEWSAAV